MHITEEGKFLQTPSVPTRTASNTFAAARDRTGPYTHSHLQGCDAITQRVDDTCRIVAVFAADHALGRSRGGFGSKFHVVTDGKGTPLAIEVTAGQVHEATVAEAVIEEATATRIGRRRKGRQRRHQPRRWAGDKAYSVRRLRDWLSGQRIEPVIPYKENQPDRHDPTIRFDRLAYRDRHVVEQRVGWLKEFRRIGTRFEKLAVNFHGMLPLAMLERYLRLLF